MNGLGNVNIELTTRCNKNCWMCGRRKRHTIKNDIDFDLLEQISEQLPPNIVVQLHNNGEGLLYKRFGDAVKLFNKQITNIVTNGKLLLEKYDDILNLDTLSISVFENDAEADEQYKIIDEFLNIKDDRKPLVVLRINGNVDESKYRKFNCIMARRVLHDPKGSFNYRKEPTVPETGMCLDLLHHMSISSDGLVSACVRYDPERTGVIGDIRKESLLNIWNGNKRMEMIDNHKHGNRDKSTLCSVCDFWGVPTSG